MARRLLETSTAYARRLLGSGYYYYNSNPCYERTGCLVGSIIGAVFFGVIALVLCTWLLVRMRRQRAAEAAPYYGNQQAAYPQPYPQPAPPNQYPPNQPYPNQYGAQNPYPPPYANNYQSSPPRAPPANMSAAEREAYEAEMFRKYGEAGVVEGIPAGQAGPSSGIEMSQLPNKH